MKMAKNILALALAAALFAVPATALGAKGGQGKSKGKAKSGQGKGKSCAKTHSRGFQVGGTLVSFTAEDVATTDASEATVTLTVTSANKHARESGELADMNAAKKGVQAKGATYTVPAGDAFELKLGDDGAAVPAAGDRVKVKGRIAVTKKGCAAEGTTVADRYAAPDVTRLKISKPEVEPTETETEVPPTA
jgi:hypothetical protein